MLDPIDSKSCYVTFNIKDVPLSVLGKTYQLSSCALWLLYPDMQDQCSFDMEPSNALKLQPWSARHVPSDDIDITHLKQQDLMNLFHNISSAIIMIQDGPPVRGEALWQGIAETGGHALCRWQVSASDPSPLPLPLPIHTLKVIFKTCFTM